MLKRQSGKMGIVAAVALAAAFGLTGRARAADQFFAGDGSALTASKWAATAAGPFTSAFTAGSTINFATVNGTGTGGSITVGGISATENFTLTSVTGTISNQSNGVIHISVAAGKTLDFSTQAFTTSAAAGYIMDGPGTLALAGGAYGGGFTLNAGTVIARGVNAMGGGALTINGGIIASNANRDFTGKFTGGITIGGDFQLGAFIANSPLASDSANLTFSNNMNLGNATRTITLGNKGNMTLGGVISGTVGSGLTFAAVTGADSTVSGNSAILLTNTANSFTGAININGPEVSFASDGSLGDVTNTLNIDGGRFTAAGTFTLTATRGIQIGGTAGTSISTKGGATILTYNGVIADKPSATGSWAKQGGGTLVLGGVSTYSGATSVNNGILQLAGGDNRLPTSTVLNLGQAASSNLGTFDMNNFNQQVAGISSTAGTNSGASTNVIKSAGAATLTLGGSGLYSFGGSAASSGVIQGAVAINKTGSGTQIFGGTNTYSGNTTVSAGKLFINGSLTGSAVTVNGTGTLGGHGDGAATGIFGGTVNIAAGGTIAPGTGPNTVGLLTTLGDVLTLSGGSNYNWNLLNAAGNAGVGFSQISAQAGLNLSTLSSGAPLTIKLTTLSAPGTPGAATFSNSSSQAWSILTSSTAIAGFDSSQYVINTANFANSLAGGSFNLSLGNSNKDLVLTFTPATATPTTLIWTGGNAQWNTADARWQNVSPNDYMWNNTTLSGATAIFNTASTVTIVNPGGTNGGVTASKLQFDASATLSNADGGTVTIATGIVTVTNGGDTATIAAPIFGTNGVAKAGAGILVLSGNNVYTGNTTVSAGVLRLAGGSAIPDGSQVSISSVAGMDVNGSTETIGSLTGSGAVALGAGTLITGGDNSDTTYSGLIFGAGNITKNGTGTFTLAGASTLGGTVTLGGGYLSITNAAALQNATGIGVAALTQLQLNVDIGGTYSLGTGAINLAGSGPAGAANAGAMIIGALTISGSTLNVGNDINFAADATINARGGSNILILTGTLTGSGTFTRAGSGTLTLAGPASTGTGATVLQNGTTNANTGNVLLSGPLTMSQSSNTNSPILNINESQTVGDLSSSYSGVAGSASNTINIAAGKTLTINQVNATAYGAPGTGSDAGKTSTIAGAGGLALSAISTGALTLAGANIYSGGTTISGGKLIVANASGSATGSGSVTLAGGVLASASVGTIAGAVSAGGAAAATIAPGDIGAIGTLTLGSTLALAANSTLHFDINGGTQDLLSIAGVLSVIGTPKIVLTAAGGLSGDYVLATFAASGVTGSSFDFTAAPAPTGYSWDVESTFIKLAVTASGVPAGSGVWKNSHADGLWDTNIVSNGNWNTGIPSAADHIATFADVAAGGATPGTVDLVTAKTIGGIVLSSTSSGYTLGAAAAPALNLQVTTGSASIEVMGSASHIIAAAVNTLSNTTINAAGGTSLTLAGGLINGASIVSITGAGNVHAAWVTNTGTVSIAGLGVHSLGNIDGATGTPHLVGVVSTIGTAAQLSSAGITTVVGDSVINATRIHQNTLNLGDGTSTNARFVVADSSPTYAENSLVPSGNDNYVSVLKTLTIPNSGGFKGTFDLGNNDLIIDYTGGSSPVTSIEAMVASGYNGGNWRGKGITSSIAAQNPGRFALTVIDNFTIATHLDIFDGVDTSSHKQVIVKFSWVADLDLDGLVTSNDAITFAAHYSEGAFANHQTGDLNYNGVFDSNDAILFAAVYSESLPHLPEPTSLGILTMGAGALLMKRRK